MDLKPLIRSVPDFPKPGIMFRDITTLLSHQAGFQSAVAQLSQKLGDQRLDYIVGIESRGFIFGAPLAHHLEIGFVPVRKPGKLPAPTLSQSYSLEYGQDQLEISAQAFPPGSRVAIVDDLIATGGTAAATAQLVADAGAELCAFGFVIELSFLQGRQTLPDGIPVHTLVVYDGEE